MVARGRGARAGAEPVALDLREVTEPAGDTTEGREDALASAGGGLDEVEDVSEDNKVEVRDLGVEGPVTEGALGGSIDDLLLGGGGPEGGALEEAIVVVFAGGFALDALVDFLTVEGAAEVDLERVEEVVVVVVALPGGAAFAAPDPNVPEFRTCPTHG